MRKSLQKIKTLLNNNPKIKYYLKKITPAFIVDKLASFAYNQSINYKSFYFNNVEIRYSLSGMTDTRGIGRVTQEQLSFMQKNTTEKVETEKVVYFYSSIHWCPTILPPNSVVMIHDVIPMVLPELFEKQYLQWKNEFYKKAHQAKHIITISKTSKNDIIRYLDIKEEDISIVNNGITKLNIAENLSIKLPEQYFIYVGAYALHKNLLVILEALREEKCLNYNLVLVGNNIEAIDIVKRLGLEERVFFLGKLNDDDMAYVIKNAVALLFPSLYEGFGLPPMEATLLHTPTICSNRPTMNEFLHNATLFADPYDHKEWATKMNKLFIDTDLQKRLIENAYQKVSKFTWENSCEKLIDTIHSKGL